MAIWGLVKDWFGNTRPARTVASATSTRIPKDASAVYVSGSATITSLVSDDSAYNRVVMFIGAASAAVVFTNTTGTTTVDQMDLGGTNLTLAAKDIMILRVNELGVWHLVSFSQNNATSITLSSDSSPVTLPNTGNIFIMTGTSSLAATSFSLTNPGEPRRVTFIGGTSCSTTFTNTNSPAAGQTYLHGADRILLEQDSISFIIQTDGSMLIESTTIA